MKRAAALQMRSIPLTAAICCRPVTFRLAEDAAQQRYASGESRAAHQDTITNSGTLTGIAALTLAARLEMAAPFLTLVNDASGSLLTAGELSVTGGDLRNAEAMLAKRYLFMRRTLTNGSAIEARKIYWMHKLTAPLTGTTGSKITSNGELALSALTLANSRQWIAKHLTLGASTLVNVVDHRR